VISELRGYEILERIATSANFVLFRVRRVSDGQKLLLKEAVTSPASRKEYALLQSLTHVGVIKPVELIDGRGHSAMLLEDFAGDWFETALPPVPIAWPAALVIAANLAQMLSVLHEAQLIHQDIRPANLLLELGTGRVCLIDFTRASP